MPKLNETGEMHIDACVSAFTLHKNELALLTVMEGGRQSLPRAAQDQTLDHAAKQALTAAFGEAQPTIEPIVEQSSSYRKKAHALTFGYAAVVRLVDLQPNEYLHPVRLQSLTESAPDLTEAEIYFVDKAIATIRPAERANWNMCLDNYLRAGPDFTLGILSRLVSNPRSFTISELRTTFEAYLSAPQPGQLREPHTIEPANFYKRISNMLIPANEFAPSKGRPAPLYSMPAHILDPTNTLQS